MKMDDARMSRLHRKGWAQVFAVNPSGMAIGV